MNVQSNNKQSSIPWMKIALIVGVVICVLVFSGRAGLEQLLGLDPGTLGGTVAQKDNEDKDDPKFDNFDDDWKKDAADKTNSKSNASQNNSSTQSNKPYLKRDGEVMRSPEGLTYYLGGRESRVDHVLRHAKDMPSRPVHGVFDGTEDEIFKLVDEAYALIKSNSNQVVDEKRDSDIRTRVAYDVDMKRRIGYLGGKSGKSKGNPAQKVLRLVIDKEIRVITAFPCK